MSPRTHLLQKEIAAGVPQPTALPNQDCIWRFGHWFFNPRWDQLALCRRQPGGPDSRRKRTGHRRVAE